MAPLYSGSGGWQHSSSLLCPSPLVAADGEREPAPGWTRSLARESLPEGERNTAEVRAHLHVCTAGMHQGAPCPADGTGDTSTVPADSTHTGNDTAGAPR